MDAPLRREFLSFDTPAKGGNCTGNFTDNVVVAPVSLQLGNGKWESAQFNSRLQPTRIALGNTQNATNLLKLDYSYGTTQNNGNILSQTITVPGTKEENGVTAVQTYAHDSLNRIKSATETIDSDESWTQSFLYDRYGNRTFDEPNTTTLTKNCGLSPTFTVCAPDRKIENPEILTSNNRIKGDQDGDSIADYVFDSSGNTKKTANGLTYVYDGENKQIEARNAANQLIGQYYYDGDGKRVKKFVPGTDETTLFVYDASGKLIAEYSTVQAETPQVAYITSDSVGSPRINTSADGAVVARHDYHPFGEEIDAVASPQRTEGLGYKADEIRKKFTGYEHDGETGLDYAQARYFTSMQGRFVTPDPLYYTASRPADPQQFNLYSYVRNNPLVLIDPSGKTLQATSVDSSGNRIPLTKKDRRALQRELSKIAPGAKVRKDGTIVFKGDVNSNGARLVSGIVNSAATTTIIVAPGSNSAQAVAVGHPPESVLPPPPAGSSTDITWDPNAVRTREVQDSPGSQVYEATVDAALILGHELIHARNIDRGVIPFGLDNEFKVGGSTYLDKEGIHSEEFRATGLENNLPGDITENDLCREMGKPIVIALSQREDWRFLYEDPPPPPRRK